MPTGQETATEVETTTVETPVEVNNTKPAPKKRGRPAKEESRAVQLTGQSVGLTAIKGLAGEVSSADLNVPPLALVQIDSKVDKAFPGAGAPGNFFLGNEFSLGKEMNIIVCTATRKWQENKPYDPNSLPKSYDSPEEARENGAYELSDLAILDLLVVVPVDSEDAEVSAHQDANWAYIPCRYFVSGRAFRSVYSALVTALTLKKDSCTYARMFKLSSRLAPARGKTLHQAFLTATNDLLTNDQLEAAEALGAGQ